MDAANDTSRRFFSRRPPGQEEYWNRMAAPRLRTRVLLNQLATRPPQRLADLGCGNGALLARIGERFPQASLTGIDFTEPQLAANRHHAPHITWLSHDLGQPLDPASDLAGAFDTLIAAELIEHVADPLTMLRVALSMACDGGRILLSTQSGPVQETERRVGHLRHFSAAEMQQLLTEAGWRPQRIWNCGFPFHDLSKWYANLRPEATMQRFGEKPYGPVERLVCLILRGLFLLNSRRRGAQLFAVATKE